MLAGRGETRPDKRNYMKTTHQLYNGEIEIIFNDFNHSYQKDGKGLPSVTGITGTINKPMLMGWAVKEAVDFMQDKIVPGKAYDEIDLVGLFNEARKAHTKSRDKSADIGTFVHEWIRKHAKGEKPEMPINEKLVTSIGHFLKWEKEHKVEFLASEQVTYSRKYDYVGTFDAIVKVDGELSLIDFKTSSGVYDEMLAQLAGYEQARNEEFPQEKYKKRGILWISREGDFDFVESKHPDQALKMFMGAREVYLSQKFYKDKYFEEKNKTTT